MSRKKRSLEEKKCNFVETAKKKKEKYTECTKTTGLRLERLFWLVKIQGNGYNKLDIIRRWGKSMVTIKQIAQEVGISSSTVSIVLGGKAAERKISTATQKKIFAAAARLGYQPNMAARSLRGGSGANELVVAMFWAQDFRASMMFRFWDGLRAEIEKTARPVRLVIYPYVNDHLKESEALTSGANCHAAIICNASYADLQFLEDTQLPIPVVLYNRVCR